jgi:hypothetical protein
MYSLERFFKDTLCEAVLWEIIPPEQIWVAESQLNLRRVTLDTV